MNRALITEDYLTDIADAIRAKNGSSDTYTPPQMAAAIEAIPTGGGVDVEALSVTANGTYTAPTGKAYSPVTVNVDGGGGITPIAMNIRSQAFIGSSNSNIVWDNTSYPNYKQFWIDLLPYQGKTLEITNTGNRNFYGFTSVEPYNGLVLNAARIDSGGRLTVTYNGGADRYLVYDFSTDINGGLVTISVR